MTSPFDETPAVIDSMAVGYLTVDSLWRITHVNAAAGDMLRRQSEELIGQDLWQMFPGSRELEFGTVYERVMTTRRSGAFEAYAPGVGIWLELRVQPFQDGIALYLLDVSARRRAFEEADAARQRSALLARASDALASSEDPDTAVGRLARVVVPQLADWTIVSVLDEDNRLRDVGWAHRDPSLEEEVAKYGAIHAAAMTGMSPIGIGLRTGEPVVVSDISDELIVAALQDQGAVDVVRRLAPRAVAAFPLSARGRTFGILALVIGPGREPHTDDEIATALEVSRRAGPVLDSARSAERARRLAERLQRSLIEIPPQTSHLSVATRYRPAYDDRAAGGDWYDCFVLPDGATIAAIGDVMGHDLTAMAAMAQLRTMMRTAAWTTRQSPAAVLTATDQASLALGPAVFATAALAELAPAAADGTVQMRWSNAGHLPPIVVEPDGSVTVLRTPTYDMPLAVIASANRCDHETTLAPGALILLYTDGLVERPDRDIDDGIAELVECLRSLAGQEPDTLLDTVLGKLTSSQPHNDDIALLALKVADHALPR